MPADGTTLTVTDVDRILNTGGVSKIACLGLNQATPWTSVDDANIVAS